MGMGQGEAGLYFGYFQKAEFPWKSNVFMLERFG